MASPFAFIRRVLGAIALAALPDALLFAQGDSVRQNHPSFPLYLEKETGVLLGELLDWDLAPECRGEIVYRDMKGKETHREPCFPFPLAKVRVQQYLAGRGPAEILLHLQMPESPTDLGSAPTRGQAVCVTFRSLPKATHWSCGRFQSCESPPDRLFLGIEMYGRLALP